MEQNQKPEIIGKNTNEKQEDENFVFVEKYEVLLEILCVGISPSSFENCKSNYSKAKEKVGEDNDTFFSNKYAGDSKKKEERRMEREDEEEKFNAKNENQKVQNKDVNGKLTNNYDDNHNDNNFCNNKWIKGKYFFGIVKKKASEVEGLHEGDIVAGYGDSSVRLKSSSHLVIQIFSLVRIAEEKGKIFETLCPIVAMTKQHIVTLKLCTEYLRLSRGDSLLLFANKIEEIVSILEFVLPLDVLVFICLPDDEVLRYKKLQNSKGFLSHPNFLNYLSKVEVCSQLDCFTEEKKENNFTNVSVNAVAVPSNFKHFDQQFESKLLRFLLKVAAPEGRIVYSYPLSQLDPIECEILHAKSLSLLFFNFEVSLFTQTSIGAHMHILLEVLSKFANKKLWLPPQQNIQTFPLHEVNKAIEFAEENADVYAVCTR